MPRREPCAPKAEGSSAVTRPARRVDVARRKLALRTDVVRHGNPTPRAALPRTKVSMADRADLAAPLGASGVGDALAHIWRYHAFQNRPEHRAGSADGSQIAAPSNVGTNPPVSGALPGADAGGVPGGRCVPRRQIGRAHV